MRRDLLELCENPFRMMCEEEGSEVFQEGGKATRHVSIYAGLKPQVTHKPMQLFVII
jgi:hypothetical protein